MKRNKITEFFRREYGGLVSYVRRRIDDAADRDAEDIVQDVMTNIFNQADITIPIDNLSAYVYRSLKNRIIDAFRRKKDVVSISEMMLDVTADTASEAEKNDLYRRLYEAIGALNPQDQAVVIAVEIEGRSFRRLSEEWGEPVGTLLARKSRAIKKIRKMLVDWEN
jgi:RNA polymerase sigma factor (sigma-70 family)